MPRVHDPETGRFTTPEKLALKNLEKAAPARMGELGVTNKHHPGRSIYEDFLPQLRGRQAIRTYTEMASNDPTVGAILFAVENLVRAPQWGVEPEDEQEPADQQAAEFVDSCLTDLDHTWDDFLASVMTMLPYGWSGFEVVYRRRNERDGSRWTDGKIGWRKFAYRHQDTLKAWDYDGQDLAGMIQSLPSGGQVTIPTDKLLLFRTVNRGTPEGRSILRNAYRPWFFLKRAEEIMMIGLKRDLTGLPVGKLPAESIVNNDTLYQSMVDQIKRVGQDEQMGVLLASDTDPDSGVPLFQLDMLGSPGRPKIEPLSVIRHFSSQIAATVLADFIFLGRDAVGSRALADPKQQLFQLALDAWADGIAETLSREAASRLLKLNGMPGRVRFTHAPVQDVNLNEIGSFLRDTAQAGMPWFDGIEEHIINRVRGMAGFDPAPDDSGLAKRFRPSLARGTR